jgi:serine/threonine protein kinase
MEQSRIGRYQIIEEIGRGGMATVHLAQDPHFDRQVAVKVLSRHMLQDPTFRARFDREARAIASLEHPAIVPIYDYGRIEDDLPFIVMHFMPGGSLCERPLPSAPVIATGRVQ